MTKKYKTTDVRKPITVKDQKEHESLEDFSEFIRRKTYMLANAFDKPKILDNLQSSLKVPKPPKNIIICKITKYYEK